ncbi:uncharacterized protein C8orf88 homolog [Hoplias malabaricus]|uniref:uncharacterized protein C8orf88 homolog n=1 Tax=Hoplias malabaricus TaxID=27720 RepID=UPI003462F6EA
MEVSRRRIRNLEPARPLRRLTEPQRDEMAESFEKAVDKSVSQIRVEQFYKILSENQIQAPAKRERISYSREFLIRLASSPMAKKKPDFLPDHPVILEKDRHQDVHMLFLDNINNNKLDMIA